VAVPLQPTYTAHTANGVTTAFPFQFLCLMAKDLEVLVNGAVVSPTGFSVTGLKQNAGGSVVFAAAPAAGASVVIRLSVLPERSTQYPPNGDWQSAVANADFDRLWLAIQQAFFLHFGTVRAPFPETLTALPRASLRARKALVFDAAGNPGVSVDDYDDQLANVTAQAQIATNAAAAAAGSAGVASNAALAAIAASSLAQTANPLGAFQINLARAVDDFTMLPGWNGLSVGPFSINPGTNVVIAPGTRWIIL
jgi:hypothetical protein